MASIVKRCASGLFAAWFTVFSVLLPLNAGAATYSAASNWSGRAWYVPATGTGVAGAAVVASAATFAARANPWVAAITIGTPIMQYLLEQNGGGNVQVMAGTNVKAPTPGGWVDADTPPGTATPLSGGTPISATSHPPGSVTKAPYLEYSAYGQTYSTFDCSQIVTDYPPGACPTITPTLAAAGQCGRFFANSYCSNTVVQAVPYCDDGYAVTGSGGSRVCTSQTTTYSCGAGYTLSGTQCLPNVTCPLGYAVSGNSCVLTDNPKVQWPSDGVPTMVPRVGQGGVYDWWPSDRDPDAPTPATGLHLKNATYFKDPFGNTIFQQITPLSTGGVQVGQMLQTTQNGQTVTTINNVVTGPDGKVIQANQRTVQGDIPTVANSANSSGEPSAIVFPDDYNREITQQKILTGEGAPDPSDWSTSVAQKQQQIEDGIKTKIEELPQQYGTDKSNWFSWVWTPPVGQCEPFTGTVHGQSVAWDICPYVAKVRDVIGYVFAIFGTWVVYNEMFRRED